MVRRGLGQSTLASASQLPAFCASVGADASAYPECGGVSSSQIAAAAAALPVGTGFALSTPSGGASQYTNAQIQALVQQAAPPVYVSSFQAQPNQGTYSSQYFIDQTAASVANEVNAANANAYSAYQTSVQNWIQNGGQGTPPAPPIYQTFTQAWAPNNMGGTPASITTQPAGSAIPAGTFLTGGQTTSGGGINYPMTGVSQGAPVAQGTTSIQSNAPAASVVTPVSSGVTQSNAPAPSVAAPSSIFEALQNFVAPATSAVSSAAGGFTIPTWAWIAGAGGLALILLWPKGK